MALALSRHHRRNSADDVFGLQYSQRQQESYWSKFKNAISNALSDVGDTLKSVRDSSSIRPATFLATLGAASAVASSVTKTAVNAIGTGLYHRNLTNAGSGILSNIAAGFTKEAFISNAYTGLWGLLIPIGLYCAKSLYMHGSVSMPGRHVSASKLGASVGYQIGLGSAIYDAKSTIFKVLFSSNWANRIMSGLATYASYKSVDSASKKIEKADLIARANPHNADIQQAVTAIKADSEFTQIVSGIFGLFTGYHFVRTFI